MHILRDGVLYTAPTDCLILPGIARHHLLLACDRLSIPYREEAFSLDELASADEILVTSSSNLCLRADHLDGKAVGGKGFTHYEQLREAVINEFLEETERP